MKMFFIKFKKYILTFILFLLMISLVLSIRMMNSYNCFYIETIEDATIEFNQVGTITTIPTLKYTIDNQIKSYTYTIGDKVELKAGQKIYFKGNNQSFCENEENYIDVCSSGKINIGGNILSLLDERCRLKDLTGRNYVFNHLFFRCTNLQSIDNLYLPATTLSDGCYEYMFEGSGLTSIPENLLPAENLAAECYYRMFAKTPITSIPENLLHSQHLVEHCYNRMFYDCDNLTEIPSELLPATILAPCCYKNMFQDCSNIKEIPSDLLQSTELKAGCYYGMFSDCASLKSIPENLLPAKNLADECYEYMFYNCFSIKVSEIKTGNYVNKIRIPSSNTGTAATDALYGMFENTSGTFVKNPSINTTYFLWDE